MNVYHGSYIEIKNPDFSHSRIDIDFGAGFYLTEDKRMASKWATNRHISILNEYELDLKGLNVIILNLSEEWLDFVASNRGYSLTEFDIQGVDVIIGPTADDKMFLTLSSCFEGVISKEQTMKYLNIAGYSNQIVLKTEKALSHLSFIKSKEIRGLEKINLKKETIYERQLSARALEEMLEKDKAHLIPDVRKLKGNTGEEQDGG